VKNIKAYIPVVIALILSMGIMVLYQVTKVEDKEPKEVYKVYLDGNYLGAIKSKRALEKYIDNEQKALKEEYDVKKVYIPNGIDIEKTITFKGEIMSEKAIYKKIKESKNFTIKGYVVTISQNEEDKESDTVEKKDDIKIYLTKKDIFDKAVKKVLNAFVPEEDSKNFANNTQPEIITTGSIIENIYINQDVNIKEAFISTEEEIYTNVNDLTKYLLFGENESEEEYTIRLGDTIETVSFNNKLSTDEFLIVNPEFTSKDNLLIPGQKVNIALIAPVLQIVVERETVEDVDKPYQTIEKEDDTLEYGTEKVEVEGVNGTQRVTEKIKYINGEIIKAYILPDSEIIKNPVDKVVVKGTKRSYYSGSFTPAISSGSWGWPTVSPYMISSYFEYRWGSFHNGIDITGCGFGSPIFAAENGTVVETYSSCDNEGWYGSTCGWGYGNMVWIAHPGNVYLVYAHMLNNVLVSPGQEVTKGQLIGYMGNSGSSTGTHLHFGAWYGATQSNGGTAFDPFTLYQ
jgi:murein DD-endopeptidase MepM/ murein hydrolase activator NlpD